MGAGRRALEKSATLCPCWALQQPGSQQRSLRLQQHFCLRREPRGLQQRWGIPKQHPLLAARWAEQSWAAILREPKAQLAGRAGALLEALERKL